MLPTPLIIYLHGFNSSPASFKARQLGKYLAEKQLACHYLVPELDVEPATAIKNLQNLVVEYKDRCDITLIGSSLGGYYATYLSEAYDLKVVHINPAVFPAQLLEDCIGINTNYHTDEQYEFTREHIAQLKDFEVVTISKPENHLVFLQTADDTLDYRDAARKFRHCHLCLEKGGSHGFDNFERIIPRIMAFSGMDAYSYRQRNT